MRRLKLSIKRKAKKEMSRKKRKGMKRKSFKSASALFKNKLLAGWR